MRMHRKEWYGTQKFVLYSAHTQANLGVCYITSSKTCLTILAFRLIQKAYLSNTEVEIPSKYALVIINDEILLFLKCQG